MFGSHKKENLKEIQGRLGIYLTSLLQRFSLPPPILLRFLEYKFSVSYCSHVIIAHIYHSVCHNFRHSSELVTKHSSFSWTYNNNKITTLS